MAGLVELVAILESIPYRARGVTVLAAPAFHAWGLANLTLGMGLQSTLVMTRRFDPERTLELVEEHRADTLVAVPVMLSADPRRSTEGEPSSHDLGRCASSRCRGRRSRRRWPTRPWICSATCSTTSTARPRSPTRRSPRPQDLRAAPGTVGRPPRGTTVKLARRRRQGGPHGRDRAHLRRQLDAVRGLHRRRQQGASSTG